MYDISHLVKRAKRYCSATGKTHGAVSKILFNDGVTLGRLIDGKSTCRIETAASAWKKLDSLELALVDQLLEERAA